MVERREVVQRTLSRRARSKEALIPLGAESVTVLLKTPRALRRIFDVFFLER